MYNFYKDLTKIYHEEQEQSKFHVIILARVYRFVQTVLKSNYSPRSTPSVVCFLTCILQSASLVSLLDLSLILSPPSLTEVASLSNSGMEQSQVLNARDTEFLRQVQATQLYKQHEARQAVQNR